MTLYNPKEAQHIPYARQHKEPYGISPNFKTSIRVFKKEWLQFKELVHSYGLTTCFVLRELMNSWTYASARPTGYENPESLFYHTESMTLYVLDKYGRFKIGARARTAKKRVKLK